MIKGSGEMMLEYIKPIRKRMLVDNKRSLVKAGID
jgi:hypothetical protein